MEKMPRLKDIAAKAGVSVMTVSKVLRDASDVSVATKVRIRQLALEMGYMPDSMAQGLRSRTTHLLGLVIPAATNQIFARVVLAIEEQAHALGYDLLLAHSLNGVEREEAVVRRLLSRRVDGLFIAPVYRLDPKASIYDELARRGTPTVLLGHRAPFCAKFINVETDDLGGSYAATRHLLSLGHKRIAFFTGPPAAPSSHERIEGYRRALREEQIETDDSLIFNAGSTIEEGEKAALQMLQENPKATALQAASDLTAIGAANIFIQQGIKLPEELSIVGFGNLLLGEYFRIPLTTVRQAKLTLGASAVEAMRRLLRGEQPESKRLGAELLIRQSTAPARG
jgi:LacI family transcriptional regulator